MAMRLKIVGNKIYRHVADNRLLATLFFLCYRVYQKLRYEECRPTLDKVTPCWKEEKTVLKSELNKVTVAMICDDMTWANWKQECRVIALTPNNWKRVLCQERPDVFFCESAWTGLKEHKGCWHGQIYRNHKLLFDNRKELLHILDFCKTHKIPTVFWNKEDPTFFESTRYDFKDTALKFDWIFTTAEECVKRYHYLGHKQVRVMMFGFSPYLFNPLGCLPKEKKAIFAGSWYGEDKQRCKSMEQIFDTVLKQNVPLVIYDRQATGAKAGRRYPKRYQPYVRAGVPLEQLGKELKHTMYSININTVTKSETMFARRVFELIAMNSIIISNDSKGMRKLFPDGVWYLAESFPLKDKEIVARHNMDLVFRYHTNEVRLRDMFHQIGILGKQDKIRIAVSYRGKEQEAEKNRDYWEEERFVAERIYGQVENSSRKINYQYGILLGEGKILDIDKIISHFCYLPNGCGILIVGDGSYTVVEDAEHVDVLYPWKTFEKVLRKKTCITKKYLLGRNEE